MYFNCRFAAPFNFRHQLVPRHEDTCGAIVGRDNAEAGTTCRTDDVAVKNVWVDWSELEGVEIRRGIGGGR